MHTHNMQAHTFEFCYDQHVKKKVILKNKIETKRERERERQKKEE